MGLLFLLVQQPADLHPRRHDRQNSRCSLGQGQLDWEKSRAGTLSSGPKKINLAAKLFLAKV
jgi:hypothetical protein